MKFTMPGSQAGQHSKALKGRHLSGETLKYIEGLRKIKGVIDVWAGGSDMTFVKLRNFRVVCIRGQNTDVLDEQLREMNKMNNRSSSLGSGLNEILTRPFRDRTRSELPERPMKRSIDKRRTSDTAASDLKLAETKVSGSQQKGTARQESCTKDSKPHVHIWGSNSRETSPNELSRVDENGLLTADDISQEHSSMRNRASSFGARRLSPTDDTEFRPRTRSESMPRSARPKLSPGFRDGYKDTSHYFSYKNGLFIPPEADIKKITSKSSPNIVITVDEPETEDKEESRNMNGTPRRISTVCDFIATKDNATSKAEFHALIQDLKNKYGSPSVGNKGTKRPSLPDIGSDGIVTTKKYTGNKRPSVTGVMAYDLENILPSRHPGKHDGDILHPKKIAQMFKGLTIKKDPEDNEKSDPHGNDTSNRSSLPTKDGKDQQSSGILSSIWNFFTKKRNPTPTPQLPKPRPRALSMDPQMLSKQLRLARQIRDNVDEKEIKVSRPGCSKPIILSKLNTLGGLPESEENGIHPAPFPKHVTVNSHTNMVPKHGRRASCPVIFESDELKEFHAPKHHVRNRFSPPGLLGAEVLPKHIGLSIHLEHQSENDEISSHSKLSEHRDEQTDSDDSSDTGVDIVNEDRAAMSEIDGVPFIIERRSTGGMSSSKSESSDISGRMGSRPTFNITSDDLSSSSTSESEESWGDVNGKSSTHASTSRKQTRKPKPASLKPKTLVSAAKARKVMNDEKTVTALPPRVLSSVSWTESSITLSSLTSDGMSSDRPSKVSSPTCSADESSG